MAKKKTTKKAADAFGPLEPQPGDEEIEVTDTAESVVGRVQLACDDETGVFFFRSGGKLFLRVVEFG